MTAPPALHRHQLVWPDARGWVALQQRGPTPLDPVVSDCLAHWARQDLPLVVTRQPPASKDVIALGLPAPLRWQRRRIALRLAPERVARFGEFPPANTIDPLLPPAQRPVWRDLIQQIDAIAGQPTRVHGSYGWEALTGERCVQAGSDLDLLLIADNLATADAIGERLDTTAFAGPRLDGELLFSGAGIAWREWRRWRAAMTDRVLVKRLHGVALESAVTFSAAVR